MSSDDVDLQRARNQGAVDMLLMLMSVLYLTASVAGAVGGNWPLAAGGLGIGALQLWASQLSWGDQ